MLRQRTRCLRPGFPVGQLQGWVVRDGGAFRLRRRPVELRSTWADGGVRPFADACALYIWTLDAALPYWFYLFSTQYTRKVKSGLLSQPPHLFIDGEMSSEERTPKYPCSTAKTLRDRLARALMTTGEPAVLGLAAVLIERFVPLMPPLAGGFHRGVTGFNARVVLASVIERPDSLPVCRRQD
jgi:hypothetical protein